MLKRPVLTAESVQAAVESRLRSARIYTDVADNHFLYINIHVMEKSFSHWFVF